jgi:small subunit ribosomal protein S7
MPRKGYVPRREVAGDPKFDNVLVTRFISALMGRGKRSLAERQFYGAMTIVEGKTGQDAMTVLKQAMTNVKPVLEVKSRRVGGSNYQVPIEVNPNRRLSLSIRWLVSNARSRGDGKTMQEKLANELLDASNLRGGAGRDWGDDGRGGSGNRVGLVGIPSPRTR